MTSKRLVLVGLLSNVHDIADTIIIQTFTLYNLGHNATVDCSINCPEVEMGQFLQSHPEFETSLTVKNISTFISVGT